MHIEELLFIAVVVFGLYFYRNKKDQNIKCKDAFIKWFDVQYENENEKNSNNHNCVNSTILVRKAAS